MKRAALATLASLLLSACAGNLETIVDARHQARLDAANAGKPITHGASDGLGSSIADTAPEGISLSDRPRPPQ